MHAAPGGAVAAPRHRLALALAAIPFALHLAALTKYDFFRDELYFIVCGRHPAFGYVDQPPLVPLLAALSQLAGESLWLLRIIPAFFHVGAVLAACAVARLLGGGRGAQVLAGLATGIAPVLLGVTATLSTTSLEPLSWTLVAYAALRAVLRERPRWWLVAGIVAGVSLEDKYTIAFLLVAIVAGIAAVGPRSTFRRRQFWIGAAFALAIAAPSLIWQSLSGWPFLELLQAGAAGKNVVLAPLPWLLQQALIYGPAFAPLWIGGLIGLCAVERTRFYGVAALLLFGAFIALHAKDYYLAGLYPVLFAAGGAAIEALIRSVRIRTAYAVLAAACALVFAPFAVPLLDETTFIAYAQRVNGLLGISFTESEHHRRGVLPQLFADMHGWRELADRVAVAERLLTPQEREHAAIFAQNYGEASAVAIFGDAEIPVISGHNSYAVWGPLGAHPVVIIIGSNLLDNERFFRDVRQIVTVHTPYAMPYENDLPIFIARYPRIDLRHIWPQLRHYD